MRGKLCFNVYIKYKLTKWGVKLYELCESTRSYVYDFEIFARETGLSNKPTDVCVRLMNPLLHKGYWLHTDNYYTCPALSDQLPAAQTMTVGTFRPNRVGMPKDLAAPPKKQSTP